MRFFSTPKPNLHKKYYTTVKNEDLTLPMAKIYYCSSLTILSFSNRMKAVQPSGRAGSEIYDKMANNTVAGLR